jgi:methanogenic corrinoid protein MtbC1
MKQNNSFLAGVLSAGTRALAAYAAGELLDRHPEAKADFGSDPLGVWRSSLERRLEELSVAVAADRPEIFVSQARWAAGALSARGVPADRLRAAFECVRDVLATELPESVRPLAAEYLDRVIQSFARPPAEPESVLSPGTPDGRLAASYLMAIFQGDRRRAIRLILDAAEAQRDVRDLYLDVLVPAQREVGRMWLTTEINTAEEHFATETTRAVITRLADRAPLRPPNGKTALTAAAVGNQHDVGLQIVASFFELEGWRVINLGANVPVCDLVQATVFFAADLLLLSAALSIQLSAVADAIKAVREGERGRNVKILAGGLAFADLGDLATELGADGYALTAPGAVALGNRLVGLPSPAKAD